jgi:hypothetical protein
VRKRPAVLACSALGCTAVGVALATAGPAATGCTTHQCDSSSYDWFPAERLPDGGQTAGGFMVDENTYVSNAIIGNINSDWPGYNGMTTIRFWFPPEVLGRTPELPFVWVGLDPTPNGGDAYVVPDNYTMASGQLAILNFLETAPADKNPGGHAVGGGVWVTNGTCASYFVHVEVHFVDGGSPVDAQADSGALGTLVDAGGDAVVGAAAPLDAAADGSD